MAGGTPSAENVIGIFYLGDSGEESPIRLLQSLLPKSDDDSSLHISTRYYKANVSLKPISELRGKSECDALVLVSSISLLESTKKFWEAAVADVAEDVTRLLVLERGPKTEAELNGLLCWAATHSIELVCPEVCESDIRARIVEALECTKWRQMSLLRKTSAPASDDAVRGTRKGGAVIQGNRTHRLLSLGDQDKILGTLLEDDDGSGSDCP